MLEQNGISYIKNRHEGVVVIATGRQLGMEAKVSCWIYPATSREGFRTSRFKYVGSSSPSVIMNSSYQ